MISLFPGMHADAKHFKVGGLEEMLGPNAPEVVLIFGVLCVFTLIWKYL